MGLGEADEGGGGRRGLWGVAAALPKGVPSVEALWEQAA